MSTHRSAWLIVAPFLVAAGCAQTAGDPIIVSGRDTVNGLQLTLHNTRSFPVTAVAFIADDVPLASEPLFDAALQQWTEIPPVGERSITFADRRARRLAAAIFADGVTFGDPALIGKLLARRRQMLTGLMIVLEHLPTGLDSRTPPEKVMEAFQLSRQALLAATPDRDIKGAVINISLIVRRRLAKPQASTDAFGATVLALQDWRLALMQSQPNLLQ